MQLRHGSSELSSDFLSPRLLLFDTSEMAAKRKTVKDVSELVENLEKKIKNLEEKVKEIEKLDERVKYLEDALQKPKSYHEEHSVCNNHKRMRENMKCRQCESIF